MKVSQLGRHFEDGEAIYREGEEGTAMFVIQTGKVRITKKAAGQEVLLGELGEGDVFGEMAIFGDRVRPVTATAVGETWALSISRKKLFSLVARDASLAFRLFEAMGNRVDQLTEEFARFQKDKMEIIESGFGVDETCHLVLEHVKTNLRADNGSIMILDQSENLLKVKEAFGDKAPKALRLAPGTGVAGNVFATGKAALVKNVAKDRRFMNGALSMKSLICVPIQCDAQTYGVMNVSSYTEGALTSANLKLLHSLSLSCALSFKRMEEIEKIGQAEERFVDSVQFMRL